MRRAAPHLIWPRRTWPPWIARQPRREERKATPTPQASRLQESFCGFSLVPAPAGPVTSRPRNTKSGAIIYAPQAQAKRDPATHVVGSGAAVSFSWQVLVQYTAFG